MALGSFYMVILAVTRAGMEVFVLIQCRFGKRSLTSVFGLESKQLKPRKAPDLVTCRRVGTCCTSLNCSDYK